MRGRCNKHKRWIFIASGDTCRGRYLRIGFFSFVSTTKKSKTLQAIARPCRLSLLGIDQWPGYCRCKSGPQHGWTKWLLRVLQKLTRASYSHPSKTTAHATPRLRGL